ncbi:MAG: cupin domain-containing protein [Solirubrobacterales bacterium]
MARGEPIATGADADPELGVPRERRAAEVTASLGARIRGLRLARKLSLREVAADAQVSPSLLSQIERGEASPSLLSLVAIADALGVRPGVLLDDRSEAGQEPSIVVRREQRLVIDDELCRREYMMHLDDPYLEVAELSVAPGGASRPALAAHSGRDYGLVISGQIVVELDDQEETLRRGDYVAFDSDRPHRIVNRSSRPARVLWIIAHDRSDAGATRRASLRDA